MAFLGNKLFSIILVSSKLQFVKILKILKINVHFESKLICVYVYVQDKNPVQSDTRRSTFFITNTIVINKYIVHVHVHWCMNNHIIVREVEFEITTELNMHSHLQILL